jgi:hypothetical protein
MADEDNTPVLLRLNAAKEERDWECVIALMREHAHDADVQRRGCQHLCALDLCAVNFADAAVATDAALAVAAGAIEVMVAALHAFPESEALQCSGLRALSGLRFGDDSSHAGTLGAVEAVVAAMRTHAAAEEVQQRGLLALFQFVAPNSDNAARAEAAGAMRAIAHALSMPAHVAELRANTQAAMLLVQLLLAVEKVHPGRTVAHLPAVVETLLRALHVCADDHETQLECLLALDMLATNALNAERAIARGAYEAVLPLLASHTGPNMTALLEEACRLLVSLCRNAESAEKAGRLGVVGVLLAWLRAHPRNKKVQVCGWMVMSALCTYCRTNAVAALHGGALALLQQARRFHSASQDFMHDVHALLFCLRQEQLAQQRSGAQGAAAPLDVAAVAAADAAMAALLAEEDAEREAAQAPKRKSKKKRGARAGAGGAPAAAGASCDDTAVHEIPAAAPMHADETSAAGSAAEVAEVAEDGPPAPVAPAPPAPGTNTPGSVAEVAAASAVPDGGAGSCNAFAAVVVPAAVHEQQPPVAGVPSAAAVAVAALSAALSTAAQPRRAPREYRPPMGAPPPPFDAAGVQSLLPPAPSLLPPAQPPALSHAAASDEAAAAVEALLPGLVGLALGALQHLPQAAPAAPALLPPPATRECCICFLDVVQDDLRLLSPCGHRCVCVECAAVLMARPPAARLCPKCREPVVFATRVFDE